MVTILFFASLKEKAGLNRLVLDLLDNTTVRELKSLLGERFPALMSALPTCIVSINRQFAFDDDPVPPGVEIGIFPPVSGGSWLQVIRVVEEPVLQDELVRQVTLPSTGAVCVFTGVVRAQTERGESHQTLALEYEAYIPMAEAKMAQVAQEIRERWPAVEGIALVQRIGRLEPGTPTVVIACSAAHRDTGVFEAARYGIDRLKEIVPVWKKEIGPNGEVWVEGHFHPAPGD